MLKLFFFALYFCTSLVQAKPIEINVGVYSFPPFVEISNTKASGLSIDLINFLNSKQDKYFFRPVITSSKRRYDDMKNGLYDLILFESIQWGWNKNDVEASNVYMSGGEVYITKNEKGKGQAYFENLNSKTIRLINGYHYGFLNYSNDPKKTEGWLITRTNSHAGNIFSVIEGKSDIAVVTKAFLDIFVSRYPIEAKSLLVSKKLDQKYNHTALVKKTSNFKITEFNSFLKKYANDPDFLQIIEGSQVRMSFGDKIPPFTFPESDSGIEIDVIREALAYKRHKLVPMYVPLARVPIVYEQFSDVDSAMTDLGHQFKKGTPVYYGNSAITYHNVFITLKKRNIKIEGPKDLENFSLLSFQGAKLRYPNWITMKDYFESNNQETQIRHLISGKVDVVLSDINIFKYYFFKLFKNKSFNDFSVHEFTKVNPDDYRPIFKSKKTRDDFNEGLEYLKKNGRYKDIFKQYIKDGVK